MPQISYCYHRANYLLSVLLDYEILATSDCLVFVTSNGVLQCALLAEHARLNTNTSGVYGQILPNVITA